MDSQRILLVGAGLAEAGLARAALRQLPVPVDLVTAHDPREGLALLEAWARDGGVPRLVLLDLPLPRASDVVRRMRADARLDAVPAVLLTTPQDKPTLAELCRAGADSFLPRPTDAADFAGLAKALHQHWLRWPTVLPPLPRPAAAKERAVPVQAVPVKGPSQRVVVTPAPQAPPTPEGALGAARNALVPIKVMLYLLERGTMGPLTQRQRGAVSLVERNVRQLTTLLHHLRATGGDADAPDPPAARRGEPT